MSAFVTFTALIAGLALVSIPPADAAERGVAVVLDYRVVKTCPDGQRPEVPRLTVAPVVGLHPALLHRPVGRR